MDSAISSAGEHYIDIVGVTGSIPVSRTIFKLFADCQNQNVNVSHDSRIKSKNNKDELYAVAAKNVERL